MCRVGGFCIPLLNNFKNNTIIKESNIQRINSINYQLASKLQEVDRWNQLISHLSSMLQAWGIGHHILESVLHAICWEGIYIFDTQNSNL